MIEHDLKNEAEAARSLIANLRDVLDDDDQLTHDMIEGETALFDAAATAVARLSEVEGFAAAIDDRIKSLATRKQRLEAQAERIRTAILVAMGVAGLKKMELAIATISVRAVAPKVVIGNEADIPSTFWVPSDPRLDRKALLAALKDGATIPGATLSNGSETLSIRLE
jgi:hypothetical protein